MSRLSIATSVMPWNLAMIPQESSNSWKSQSRISLILILVSFLVLNKTSNQNQEISCESFSTQYVNKFLKISKRLISVDSQSSSGSWSRLTLDCVDYPMPINSEVQLADLDKHRMRCN